MLTKYEEELKEEIKIDQDAQDAIDSLIYSYNDLRVPRVHWISDIDGFMTSNISYLN